MFPFFSEFCLSSLEGRNINMSKGSIKKIFLYVRFSEWENSGGKVCYLGKEITASGSKHKCRLLYRIQQCTRMSYRDDEVDSIYFNSSCICLLHWCNDALLWRKCETRNLKNIRDFLDHLPASRFTCGQ